MAAAATTSRSIERLGRLRHKAGAGTPPSYKVASARLDGILAELAPSRHPRYRVLIQILRALMNNWLFGEAPANAITFLRAGKEFSG